MHYRIPKGVFDLLPEDQEAWRASHLWQFVEGEIRTLAELFGYREIRTPLFESTALFTRSIGETSDIVSKEMYTFLDRAERSLTLRPEGTAPVMRALIEKGCVGVHKLFYIAPMFRYERQQAGRYRQHHQFGVETVGVRSPFQDVEVIELLYTFYRRLGLSNLTVHINSIGSQQTRTAFRTALKNYLKPHLSSLSSDSQKRYESNPLRILDSKDKGDQEILEKAPSILDFLDQEGRAHFDTVCASLNIPFTLNSKLVRGLDYYTDTVFEITADELGAQNSLGGGGRYDGLIKELGGPDTPAFGFGSGIERIIQTCLAQKVSLPLPPSVDLLLIPLGDEARRFCFQQLTLLRQAGIKAEMEFTEKKLKQVMKQAHTKGVRFVAVVGDEELAEKKCALKEMESGKSATLSFDQMKKRVKDG